MSESGSTASALGRHWRVPLIATFVLMLVNTGIALAQRDWTLALATIVAAYYVSAYYRLKVKVVDALLEEGFDVETR